MGFFVLIPAGMILVVGVLLYWVRALKKSAAKQVLSKFSRHKIYGFTSEANFFGQERLGWGQVRGNGVLALVEGELYFRMLAPKREYRIPWESMCGVVTPKSHLGKTRGVKLLKVEFINYNGKNDSMAWQVPNVDEWQSSLAQVIEGQQLC